ncbi:copper resistance protein [Brevirhabdus pacifica]|uniref:Copper resistance protein n=1 Tax=Brevirhabdus pacifica TaxID=1267768 RepID=A0A1U7DKP1_9RHOB|nr:TolC family protein [Brevirhabdus pacifica]APX90556.1 copper resistance protein [Brevirhabdus pacifica]OWU78443.1 copper resistance protein [Loktanella sp. 22II-4b]PJJ85315.1 outer membrane protein TolC [Brevirhabdus pacifica]
MKRATLATTACALVLSACASTEQRSFLSDRQAGFATVASRTSAVTGSQPAWAQSTADVQKNAARVSTLVRGKTIGPDTAVQVALLNNRGLQAAYAEIGLSSAEVWQTTMRPNPTLSVGLTGLGAEALLVRAIEAAVATNLLALRTQKRRTAIAETRFRQAQLVAAEATLAVAHETRLAWINAVAAFEQAQLIGEAQSTAEAAAELAAELGRTGFLNAADQTREFAFESELAGQRAEARLAARQAKEALTRVMGLWGADLDYYVPDRLPALPAIRPRAKIEAEALTRRVDLAVARLELEAVAREFDLTEATRVLSDLDLVTGVEIEREREDGATRTAATGRVEIDFPIPIFDSGEARRRKGELTYLRAAHQLAGQAVAVRSEARAAHDAWVGSHEIARHYRSAVLPLRRQIERESLLSYNGMITNTFELIADTRARLGSSQAEAQARAAFWRADTALGAAIHGGGSAGSGTGGGAAAPVQAQAGGAGH